MDAELHKLAVGGLMQMFKKTNPTANLGSNGDILVNGQRIDVGPAVEQCGNKDGLWFCGVRFDLLLNGKKAQRFTSGMVGQGNSKEEAGKDAVADWLALFGESFAPAMLKLDNGIDVGGFIAYPGAMQIRGTPPGEWIDATHPMHKRVLSVLLPILAEPNDGSSPMTLNLRVEVNANGKITGECRKNGELSAQVLTSLAQLPWPKPKTGSLYMFKQYYILSRR